MSIVSHSLVFVYPNEVLESSQMVSSHNSLALCNESNDHSVAENERDGVGREVWARQRRKRGMFREVDKGR